ncbi:MAG: hypothetical protein JWP03_5075, partial [Phycisphaerales bacterium]|nr:hypothetical protein [Phycisphaerales bacterium]
MQSAKTKMQSGRRGAEYPPAAAFHFDFCSLHSAL